MQGAQESENHDPISATAWSKIKEIIHLTFTNGSVQKAFGRGILVLIPKGVPDQYRGIALLEVVYKLVSTIINIRIHQIK
jgi:hypothetical protein